MTKMKESGIDWIGQIPEEWEVTKLKYALLINNGKDYKDIEVEEGGYPVIGSGGVFARSRNYMYDGDVVLLGRKGTIDKPLFYSGKFWTVDTMFYSTALNGNNIKFMYYSSLLIPFSYYSTATALPSMTQSDLNNHMLCLPSISEQQKIADFLDKKIAQLDKVKALLGEQIQKLKDYRASLIYETVTKGLDTTVPMKDSGIDWIGQIPEEWEVSKLEQYVDIFGRIGFRGYTTNDIVNEGEGAISYSPSNIIDYSVIDNNNTYISWSKYDESPEIQIKTGDVLYVKTGSSYGKAGIVNKLSNKATINPQLVVLKPKKNTDSRLINYFLNSSVGKDQSELIVGGSTIPTITQESIKKMIFPKMSFEEQQKIADFLDKKTIQIDKLIQIKNQQIENINKQRQTLIYDYVTGKRRV